MFILLFNYIYYERKHDFKLNVSTYVCSWTFCITMISMLDEALWIIVLMDLVVTYETSICWLCVFEGIASILKKQILIQVTHLSIHMDLFLFLYHSFFKKNKTIPFTKTRIKLNHRIKQKIDPFMLHGSRQIGKKNTVLASSKHKDSSCIPLFNILISRIFWEINR